MADAVIAGRYRLDELLGRGGMSEVWSAEDLELGRRVAIKLLAPDADQARFEREARAVASLAHPNVSQLYDYGEENGRPYMVLEYLGGDTLESRLDGKPLPDDEAYGIAAGIAAGLAHAHARGVVHRDLKPANVLFDEEGRPKLADFGIARMAVGEGTLTEAGTVLGTAAYISPEQAMGEPATPASDVYSFGVILYRLLTGRLPFESKDPLQLVLLHRDATPTPIAELRDDAPVALESTATAALAKNPADRPADGAALLTELGVPTGGSVTSAASALPGDATRVLPAADPPARAAAYEAYPTPPPQRRRVPLIAAAVLVLALVGAGIAYALTRPANGSNTPSVTSVTQPTTHKPTTTAPTTSTAETTTAATTTTGRTTTAPTTTARPTTTHEQTLPPPTTAPPPPTTTAPPPTTAPTTTATDTSGATVTLP